MRDGKRQKKGSPRLCHSLLIWSAAQYINYANDSCFLMLCRQTHKNLLMGKSWAGRTGLGCLLFRLLLVLGAGVLRKKSRRGAVNLEGGRGKASPNACRVISISDLIPLSPPRRDWKYDEWLSIFHGPRNFLLSFCPHHSPNECLRWLKVLMKNYCRDFFFRLRLLLLLMDDSLFFVCLLFVWKNKARMKRRKLFFFSSAAWQNCQANFSHIYHLGLINLRTRRSGEDESLSCSKPNVWFTLDFASMTRN